MTSLHFQLAKPSQVQSIFVTGSYYFPSAAIFLCETVLRSDLFVRGGTGLTEILAR